MVLPVEATNTDHLSTVIHLQSDLFYWQWMIRTRATAYARELTCNSSVRKKNIEERK